MDEQRICRLTSKPFTLTDLEKECYARFGLPPQDIHPHERIRPVNGWINAYVLQWTTDAKSGKRILTNLDSKKFPVIYEHKYWSGPDFEAKEFGRDIDFSRPFFEQWNELFCATPQPNLTLIESEDCDYCNYVVRSKGCYLLFHGPNDENVHYSALAYDSKDSIELFNSVKCQQCFQCIFCTNCYDVRFAEFAENCTSSTFLYNCHDCIDCYQCTGLQHKSYCIQNKQYSKEEYQQKMKEMDLGSHAVLQEEKKKWAEFLRTRPIRGERLIHCEDSDGIILTNCKDCHASFTLRDSERCYNCLGFQAVDCADSACFPAQRVAYAQGCLNSSDTYCVWAADNCYNVGYSMMLFNCHDCFGCYGLKKSAYCILNKQYTAEEYPMVLAKLIEHMNKTGEWGKWFPASMSPFYYQDSAAWALFPKPTEEEAKKLGLRMRPAGVDVETAPASASVLPDHVREAAGSVTTETFVCETSGRPYKITAQELVFHQKQNLALPRQQWRTRIEQFYHTTIPLPYETKCAQCQKAIYSMVNPATTQRSIWCDQCYLAAFGA